MKNGFTLIELLAVIVILAIIALIATPIIMNVIDDAKKGAFQNTAYGIIEAAELSYAMDTMRGTNGAVTYTYHDAIEQSNVPNKKLDYKGTKPTTGEVRIDNDGKIGIAIHDGKYCAEKDFDQMEVTVSVKEIVECVLPTD